MKAQPKPQPPKNKKAISGGGFSLSKYKYQLIIFFSAFLLYANSIGNDYNLDDELVTRNHRLTSQGIQAIPEIFTAPYYQDAMGYAYEYRPIVLVSFAIEHSMFGENVHMSHFINVLLYGLLCLLLFAGLTLIFVEYGALIPFVATMLFVVHPIHTEIVDSIKNRDEILALLGALGACYFALKFIDTPKWMYLLLVSGLYALGLLSKQSILSMVLLIPLVLLFFRKYKLWQLLAVVMVLLVPLVLIVQLSTLKDKLLLSGAVLAATLVLHFILIAGHEKNIFQVLQHGLSNIVKSLLTPRQDFKLKEVDYGIKQDGTAVDLKWILIALMFTVIGVGLTFYGIYKSYTWLAVFATSAYLFVAFLGNDALKKLLFIPAMIALMATVYSFEEGVGFYLGVYFMIALVYLLYYKGTFKYVAILPLAIAIILSIYPGTFWSNLLLGAIFIGLTFYRRYFYVLWGLTILAVFGNFIQPLVHWITVKFEYDDEIIILLTILPILMVYRPKAVKLFPLFSWIAITFNLLFLLVLSNSADKSFYHSPVSAVTVNKLQMSLPFLAKAVNVTTNGINATGSVIVKQNVNKSVERPIDFIETPVNMHDKQTLRIGTAFLILSKYLPKVVVPYPMSFYYGYKVIYPARITETVPLISLIIHLILGLLALYLIRKRPLISFCVLFYLVAISMFSNYFYPVPGLLGDRFLFIPSLAWCLLLAISAAYILKIEIKTPLENLMTLPVAYRVGIGMFLVLYSVMTFARNMDWKDDLTLFSHDIKCVSESSQGNNLLGTHYAIRAEKSKDPAEQKDLREHAVVYFKKALEIYPGFFNAAYDLGRTYMNLGIPDSALIYFEKALALNKELPDVQMGIANIYMSRGKSDIAIPYLEQVLQMQPNSAYGYSLLSLAYYNLHDYHKSIQVNTLCIKNNPGVVDPYINIARTYLTMNLPDSARIFADAALQIDRGNIQAQGLRNEAEAKKH